MMMVRCVLAALAAFAVGAVGSAQGVDGVGEPPVALPIHSHNDYDRDEPLLGALRAGVRSIEVDVFPGEGNLMVAHDRIEIDAARTITSMYLDPLFTRLRDTSSIYANQPENEPVVLLVDFKGDPERSLDLLVELTRPLAPWLARTDEAGRVRGKLLIVVSGNVPRASIRSRRPIDIFIDGRLPDLRRGGLSAAEAPLVSSRWWDSFTWNGRGEIPDEERARLERYVRIAHRQGHAIRFWATPDTPDAWRTLQEIGVDLINTDMPAALAAHLARTEPALTPPTASVDGEDLE